MDASQVAEDPLRRPLAEHADDLAERVDFAGLTRYRLLLDGSEAGASGSTGDGSRPGDQVRSLDSTGSSQDGSDTAID